MMPTLPGRRRVGPSSAPASPRRNVLAIPAPETKSGIPNRRMIAKVYTTYIIAWTGYWRRGHAPD
ncbi:MAG: hypothetical protein QOJ59_3623 [Thermomicrobiales bacterium]|nr:hypothetical protein [Thermomicrobiales bacterium]